VAACAGQSLTRVESDTAGGEGGRSAVEAGADDPGGSGGAVNDDVLRCVPGQTVACACADGWEGAQTCNDDGRYDACECVEGTLDWFRMNLVGEWRGTRTTPWDDPTEVTLEFDADGKWRGSCGPDCAVFYYASPDYESMNSYRLTSVNDDRIAVGSIVLTWSDDGNTTEGELRNVRFESDATELFLDFTPTWLGNLGPISFTLERQ
jgi:hypothetical protein